MVYIEEGGRYEASVVLRGTNERGEWEMVIVKDGKRSEILFFPENGPTGIEKGDYFEVTHLRAMKAGPKLNKKTNAWDKCTYGYGTIKVDKTPIFDTIDDVPFDLSDNPFDPGGPLSIPEDDQLPL